MQLYDGMRLYVAAGTNTFPFDTFTVDRMEVLRGPASVMFGEGAIGGAVNIVPRSPDAMMRSGEYQAGVGSFNSFRAAIDLTGPVNPALSYRFDASYRQADNWVQRGDSDSLALSGALRWQATPTLVFTLRDDYGDQNPMQYFGTPLIDGRLLKGTLKTNYNVTDADISYEDNWTTLKTEWTPDEAFTVRNSLYRMTSNRNWRNAEVYVWDPALSVLNRADNFIGIKHDQEQFRDRLEATFKSDLLWFDNILVLGAEANNIKFTHINNGFTDVGRPGTDVAVFNPVVGTYAALSDPITPAYHTQSDQWAMFAEDRMAFGDKFSIVSGVRWDSFKFSRTNLRTGAVFGKTFEYSDWRVGAVYQPTPTVSLYAQYATGKDPLGSLVTSSSATVAGDFDLSTARQYEVGLKQIFLGGRGQWTLAAYDIAKTKLLADVPGQPGVVAQVGERTSQGLEASLVVSPIAGLSIEANAAVLDAQFKDYVLDGVDFRSKTPMNVPEKTANLWVNYAFTPAIEGRLGVRYVGKTFSDDADAHPIPDYAVVDLGVDYALRPNTTLSLRVTNLFDETYAQTSYANDQWILGRPRAVEVSLRGKF